MSKTEFLSCLVFFSVRYADHDIVLPVHSARIRTIKSFSFLYGRVEVRAKLPRGDWLWPGNVYNILISHTFSGPGSVVGIATGYGLDGPGIESRWGRDFTHLSRPALGPTQPPVQWVLRLSRGLRAAGA